MTKKQAPLTIDVSFLFEAEEKIKWMSDALCRENGFPDLWFMPNRSIETEEARMICGKCPVRNECREYNDKAETGYDGKQVSSQMTFGVYAGETPNMRRKRRRGKEYPYE